MLRWLKTVVVSDVEKAHGIRRPALFRRINPTTIPYQMTGRQSLR
jgi:hypothetical protein